MTRRIITFWDGEKIYVSDEFNGDKAEFEQRAALFGGGDRCDKTWPEIMELLNTVTTLADFMQAIAKINGCYHSFLEGQPGYERPGNRLQIAHNLDELYALIDGLDEVYQINRGVAGAVLVEHPNVPVGVTPNRTYNGKLVRGVDTFKYSEAKPGDYVTEEVVDDAMDCLPPITYSARCSQMGEPKSSRFDEKLGQWRSTYHTFRKVSGEGPEAVWEYCGDCFAGETAIRGKEMQVVGG